MGHKARDCRVVDDAPNSGLYIKGFSERYYDKEELKYRLRHYGQIEEINVNKGWGFAVIKFSKTTEAAAVFDGFNDKTFEKGEQEPWRPV